MHNHEEWHGIIQKRLEKMTYRAGERREWLKSFGAQIDPDWYVRIRGDSYRAVSLNEASPLMGYGKDGAKEIDTILDHFREKKAGAPGKKNIHERKIHSWLIKQSLHHDLSLKPALSLDDEK